MARVSHTLLLPAVALGALFVEACGTGEINLGRAAGSGGSGEQSSGGTGGDAVAPGSGANVGVQGGAPSGSLPCILEDTCSMPCEVGMPGCFPCRSPEECVFGPPVCDAALGFCVECLDQDDCLARFGPAFPACSAGRCVQCQRDDDCGRDVQCLSGLCGRCDGDRDCWDGFDCRDRRCVPR